MNSIDFLIVGAGLAGLNIALKLKKLNLTFDIIDRNQASSSSLTAGGLINPITGKNFKLTWRYSELIEDTIAWYQEAEKLTNQNFLFQHDILRLLRTKAELQSFERAQKQPGIQAYLAEPIELPNGFIKSNSIRITKSYALDCETFTNAVRSYLQNHLTYTEFNFKNCEDKGSKILYNNKLYSNLILTTGFEAQNYLDVNFRNAKGELLTLEIPDLQTKHIISFSEFILPYQKYYKLGATYSWDELDNTPTEPNRQKLLNAFASVCNLPFKIIRHTAGVRPIVSGQKPIIGKFPAMPKTFILNGLGSKGVLYAPYCADLLINYIINNTAIDPELDLCMRIKKYARQNNRASP